MRVIITSLCICLALICANLNAQEFTTYTVKQGDTVTKLAQQYNTTVDEIYRFNPEAKTDLKIGSVLVIKANANTPNSNTSITQQRLPKTFITHKVRRKETLFSLSKTYDVTIEEIKRYNKKLYAQELKRRDRLRIPVFSKVIIGDNKVVTNPTLISNEKPIATVVNSIRTHIVKPKEGLYGISRLYGMTITELEAINPNLEMPLQPGQILNVKGEASSQSTVIIDERFMFYEVKPKENFFRLEQRFKISQDSLIALNPNLVEGLKVGMVIKIPKQENVVSVFSDTSRLNLAATINNYNKKTIALLLPFNMHKIGVDSISTVEERLKKDRVMRISLDFYSGVLMALEDAKSLGLNTGLKVFDTQQSKTKVKDIIDTNQFNDVDVVIGPLLNSSVEEASKQLEYKNIPVISPLSSRTANGKRNLVQSRPTEAMMHDIMLTYLDSMHVSQNIVIVADKKSQNLKQKLVTRFPFASVLEPEEDNFLYQVNVEEQLIDGKDNWFIVATEDIALLSNITSYLNALTSKHNIQLFTLEKNSAYDSQDISNEHLSKLKFTFPSVDKEINKELSKQFIDAYTLLYNTEPNKYAVRGYDITIDVILRLASSTSLFESMSQTGYTEYIENKFNYLDNGRDGFVNNGIYIMQHGDQLSLKPIE